MGEHSKDRYITSNRNPGETSVSNHLLANDPAGMGALLEENEILRARLNDLQVQMVEVNIHQQVELEAMRDLLGALVKAVSLDQTLEVVLVNLRNLVSYDIAGLFLLSGNGNSVQNIVKSQSEKQALMTFPKDHPLVAELQDTHAPMVVHDVQSDSRFTHWDDMQLIQSWMGVPLFVGEEMIGFLSLGSLQPNSYQDIDTRSLSNHTEQLAGVLEKAWQGDQSQTKTDEFEVLSRLSLALEHADSKEETFSTIIEQIKNLFGPAEGTFLFPDKSDTELIVKFTGDETLMGRGHPLMDDHLWRVYQTGKSSLIPNVHEYLRSDPPIIYQHLLAGKKSAVVIPLISQYSPFGVLLVAFPALLNFSPEDILLLDTITRVTSTTLRRMFALEGLERQLEIRTDQLSALYKLNTIASEPLPMAIALERILDLIVQVTKCEAGVIFLLDQSMQELRPVVEHGLSSGILSPNHRLPTSNPVLNKIIQSNRPSVIDINDSTPVSELIKPYIALRDKNLICTPIRTKNQLLGLLVLLGESGVEYAAEDITFFMTIADQIGSYVERSRLIEQAEQAAVIKERQRLARELHDSVTQSLYSQVLFAGAGLKVLQKSDLVLGKQYLTRIHQEARQALREMRLLVYELRFKDYLEEGLIEALHRRLEAVEKRSDINASLLVEGKLDLDESTEIGLYFIAMEALNNVVKHSGASTAQIKIISNKDYLSMNISDNGCGFDLRNKDFHTGIGLSSMRERVSALQGELHIITAPGLGTQIIVELVGTQ